MPMIKNLVVYLDDAAVYTRPLSATEVARLAAEGPNLVDPQLVGYWTNDRLVTVVSFSF